ncbi:hypothetical protein M433DRAFT_133909 [Acidomyces richmondensis BFW]|nr:MAG: hypothetical protein FE78DRAFT_145612 [Acidomyces sp. 'richmondensis']KYG46351.1 hypothetical protein M433DRAFT_133909 [Acidomyces richmondensis BFW]
MAEEHIDLLTIGAGGGAYPAAFRLAKAGYSVVMVDPKGVLSGNCLYEGCVPSKAMRETAEILESQRRLADKGLDGTIRVDYEKVVRHKDAIQERRYEQHATEIQQGVRLIKGHAKLISPHKVIVTADNGIFGFHCGHIIIASGCDISRPPFPGSDICLTSHDLYKPDPALKTLPARMVIIGGGYIGLETASMFAAFGSDVTVMQRGPRVLKGFDPSLTARLLPLLNKRIKLMVNVSVSAVEEKTDHKVVHFTHDNTSQTLKADVVVLTTGRRPLFPEGCTEIGIEVGRAGISVGPTLQTTFKHIYACGDVNGRVPLFHAAVRQSLVAAHNIMAGDNPLDYADFENVPNTIFTLPAAAYVGMTPAKAKEKGVELLIGRYNFIEDSRAQILEQMDGGIELFFASGSLRLLGGWVVGIDAGLLIGQIGIAVANGLTAYDLAAFADQHPMSSEGISKAARNLF